MKVGEAKEGMHVTISQNIDATDRRFSSCSDMRQMRGKKFIIKQVIREGEAVRIEGFTWAIEDIEERTPRDVPPQIFHFDTQHL